MKMVRCSLSRHAAAVVLYGALVLIYTFPLILHFTDETPSLGLNYVRIANSRFILEQLSDWGSPLSIDRIFYPVGYTIHEGFIPSLLPLLAGGAHFPVMGLNVALWFSFLAAATGAYFLAWELVRWRAAAFVAGFYYGFCFQHLAHAETYPIFHLEWLPWYAFALFRFHRTAERKWMVLAAGAFFLASLCSWYFAVFLALGTALFAPFFLKATRWRSGLELTAALAVAAIILLFFSPPILLGAHGVDAGGFRFVVDGSADLLSFVIPAPHHWYWGSAVSNLQKSWLGNPSLRANFLGFAPLALALLGLLAGRRTRTSVRLYLAITVLCFTLLALGPYLVVGGPGDWTPATDPSLIPNWKMPFYWLVDTFPFRTTRATARYSIMTILALSALLAMGIDVLGRRRGPRARKLLPAGILFVIALELWPAWPLPFRRPVPTSPFQESLKNDSAPFSILDLPFQNNGYRVLYEVSSHNHPVIGGAVDKPFARFSERIARIPFLRQAAILGTSIAGQERAQDVFTPLAEMYFPDVINRFGVQYAVVHRWDEHLLSFGDYYVPEPLAEEAVEWISRFYEPVYEDDWILVFRRAEMGQDWLFPIIGPEWGRAEQHTGYVDRALLGTTGTIQLETSREMKIDLAMEMATILIPQRDFALSINGVTLLEGTVPNREARNEWRSIELNSIQLHSGTNTLKLETHQPPRSIAEVYGGSDRRRISLLIRRVSVKRSGEGS